MKPTVLVLNASLAGPEGNTAVLLARAAKKLGRKSNVIQCTLTGKTPFAECAESLKRANAVLIGTGTHWDSWSSLLQRFLEEATPTEATALWLGKPAGVIVTMHSVGGKGVLSRLQGVLNTLGCSLPPMSGMAYSLANQSAILSRAKGSDDLWCQDDVDVICHNLLASLKLNPRYRAWPVDRADCSKKWIQQEV